MKNILAGSFLLLFVTAAAAQTPEAGQKAGTERDAGHRDHR